MDTSDWFLHVHPYPVFVPEGCTRLIVGTLPPPRFSTGELRAEDVDFCYGSCDSHLWRLLAEIYSVELRFDRSREAVRQRKDLLRAEGIGIADIVESCRRRKMDASDYTMEDVRLRDLVGLLGRYPGIDQLLFMGGRSKNGPEYFFRKQLLDHGVKLQFVAKTVNGARIHRCLLHGRSIVTVSLVSPSPAANRAIGSTRWYKRCKAANPEYSPFHYRLDQYRTCLTGLEVGAERKTPAARGQKD